MSENINFVAINNFKCKRCGYDKYDKLMFTGDKTLNEKDSIINSYYVCRNCDFPVNIDEYIVSDMINMNKQDLIDQATVIDEN